MLTRRRRRSEQGQILALALAFLVYVFLIVFAALGFASATAQQHVHTEQTAQNDAAGEGGAAFAASDAARTDISWCSATDTGTLTMADGSNTTANYSVTKCNPGQTATTVGAKGHCLLCILNQTPFGSTPAHAPGTTVFTAQCAQCSGFDLQTIGGDDYINGTVGSGTTLEACETSTKCPGQATIGVLGTSPAGCCTPTPKGGIIVTDPLASIGDPSAAGVALPSGCTSWQTCKPINCQGGTLPANTPAGTWSATAGCTVTGISQKQTFNLYPGVWSTISISGQADVVFQPGVFVLTGSLTKSGQGIICAPGTISGSPSVCASSTGVTLYLACVGGVSGGQTLAYLACPASGHTGGNVTISGGGSTTNQLSITSTPCPAGQQVPQCPGYDGVAVLADPHLLDSTTSTCIGTGTGCALSVSGNGGSINGSVDLRSAGLNIAGNGSEAISAGFLIANSFTMNVSGHVSTGLALTGPGAFVSVGNSCNVLVLNVYSGALPANVPTAVVQSQCGTAKQSGVIDFNYLP